MLKYNLQKMFAARGITNKSLFLQKCGFTRTVVYRIINDGYRNLTLKQLEVLCIELNCTPNDILEWTPGKTGQLKEDMPLKKLLVNESRTNILNTVKDVPYEKLNVLVQKIEEIKKTL